MVIPRWWYYTLVTFLGINGLAWGFQLFWRRRMERVAWQTYLNMSSKARTELILEGMRAHLKREPTEEEFRATMAKMERWAAKAEKKD